jgi:hypothetical protein
MRVCKQARTVAFHPVHTCVGRRPGEMGGTGLLHSTFLVEKPGYFQPGFQQSNMNINPGSQYQIVTFCMLHERIFDNLDFIKIKSKQTNKQNFCKRFWFFGLFGFLFCFAFPLD